MISSSPDTFKYTLISPIISPAYGVNFDSMLDKILYVVGKSDMPLLQNYCTTPGGTLFRVWTLIAYVCVCGI